MSDSVLIKILSNSLGDNIGALAVIEAYRKKAGKDVYIICNLKSEYFGKSYPKLQFLNNKEEHSLATDNKWSIGSNYYDSYYQIDYKFDKPLMQGYADQLGIEKWGRPKIDLHKGDRPIKGKYACFSMHSTAQAKHWNYPN